MGLYQTLIATSNSSVVRVGGDLTDMLRHLVALTHSTDPSDYAVWAGAVMLAIVQSSGHVIYFQTVYGHDHDKRQPTYPSREDN